MDVRLHRLAAAAAFVVLASGCASSRPSDEEGLGPIRRDFYRYTGFDEGGQRVVTGWLHFGSGRRGEVTGEWWLERVGRSTPIGPQEGLGHLVGERRAAAWVVQLNPERRDDNVILIGTFAGREFQGRWSWSGFAGVLARGTFVAVRVSEEDEKEGRSPPSPAAPPARPPDPPTSHASPTPSWSASS